MFIATVSAELPAVGAAEAVSLVIGASGGHCWPRLVA